MIWTHVWWCGRMAWRSVTLTEWTAMPHLTRGMIQARVLKAALGGGLLVCAGSGAWLVPRIVSEGDWAPVAQERPVDVPEPATLGVFALGLVVLRLIKR